MVCLAYVVENVLDFLHAKIVKEGGFLQVTLQVCTDILFSEISVSVQSKNCFNENTNLIEIHK